MAKTSLPSPEILRQLLRYEPDTGRFFWLPRGEEFFADSEKMVTAKHRAALWSGRYAGKEAMTADNGLGYRCGSILGVSVKAHHAAWVLYYGRWPELHIDHINGNRSDNRISNLREVTPKQNARNAKLRSDNTSGVQGVCFVRRDNLWRVRIGNRSIGYFKTKSEAVAARRNEEIHSGYHPNHGR